MPSLLTLADVYLTGYHAAHQGGVGPDTTVVVIGDGAVGLSGVLASRQLGADMIILMGRHTATPTSVATSAPPMSSPNAAMKGSPRSWSSPTVRAHTWSWKPSGICPAYEQAYSVLRPGGTLSRVGVPQYADAPVGFASLFGKNATLTGGPAPVRAYIESVLPQVLDGSIEPGRVFDRELSLSDIAEAYRLMDSRDALKVLIRP